MEFIDATTIFMAYFIDKVKNVEVSQLMKMVGCKNSL